MTPSQAFASIGISRFAVRRRHGHHRTWIAVVNLVVISACHDAVPTTKQDPATIVRHAVSSAAALSDSSWDTYVADVQVTLTRLDSTGTPLLGRPPMQYHVERTLSTDKQHWRSVMTFRPEGQDPRPASVTRKSPPAFTMSRIEDDGDGSPPRMYNGLGQLITMPKAAEMRQHMPGTSPMLADFETQTNAAKAQLQAANEQARAKRKNGDESHAPPSAADRNWIRSTVFVRSEAAARRAAWQKRFGSPVRQSGAQEEL